MWSQVFVITSVIRLNAGVIIKLKMETHALKAWWSYIGSSDQKLIFMQLWKDNVSVFEEFNYYLVHFSLPLVRDWPISFMKDVLSGKKQVSVG